MSSVRASFARHLGSARLIGLAAAFSAIVHFIAFAALSGMLAVPSASRTSPPLQATLVQVMPVEPEIARPTPLPASRSVRNPERGTITPPVRISEPEVAGPPQIISRADERRPTTAPAPVASTIADPAIEPAPSPDLYSSAQSALPVADPPKVIAYKPPPRRILLEYELKSSLVDGRARYLWTTDATHRRYTIEGSMEADGFFASMFAGRFEQESTGEIVANRLRPDRFSLRRGEALAEVARFDWVARQITHQRVRGEHVQPLGEDAQDLQSFIFQFSYEFKRPATPERVSFAITNARKLDNYEFRVAGRERLRLPVGELDTIHLVRVAQDPGDAYEAWLSPAHEYLPVKIRFMLSGRFPVDQLATRIDIEP